MKRNIESLYEEYHTVVFSCIYCMIKDFDNPVETSHDLSQDTWNKIIRKFDTIGEDANYIGWIKVVARNVTLDWMRKQKTRRKYESISDEQVMLADMSNLRGDPEDRYICQESIQEAYGGMRNVEVLVSFYSAQGYKSSEIPRIIKERIGTIYQPSVIRSLLSKSNAKFRELYAEI
jgi:hypothetical protein